MRTRTLPARLEANPNDVGDRTVLELRTQLVTGLQVYATRRGLNQAALANRLGTTQSSIHKIVAGDVGGLSLDHLVRLAARAAAQPSTTPKDQESTP